MEFEYHVEMIVEAVSMCVPFPTVLMLTVVAIMLLYVAEHASASCGTACTSRNKDSQFGH